jgi:adenylylsulfate kinase
VVVWLTGLPSSGKSTLAAAVQRALRAGGTPCGLLAGDAVRAALVPEPGYAEAEREAFYRTLGNLAALLCGQGLAVLVAATAHRRAFREHARGVARRFVEVYVSTPLEECARRDAMGLYAKAGKGGAPSMPGAGTAYEPPRSPEVVAPRGSDEESVARVVRAVLAAQAG